MKDQNTLTYRQKVKKIVDEVIKEKNDNPRDSAFRFFQEYHREAQHISLRYPGIYLKSLGTEVFTINNRNRRVDGAELVLPDDTLPCESVINPEQQTKPISPEKSHALYDYKLHFTFKYKLPCLNVVVTNIGDEDHTVIYESHGDAFKVYVRVFNDEEISKRLNNLSDNIHNKKQLSEIEVLDFGYILIFAQEDKAKNYSQKVAKLFTEVKNLDISLQLDIYYVLKKLIRLHFRDDETKTRELLTMITKAIHPELLDKLPTLKKAIENEEKRTEELYITRNELNSTKNKLNNTKDELNNTKNKLNNTEDELNSAQNEIKKLKQKLKDNNIEVD